MPGHLRLYCSESLKTWMPGSSPGMTTLIGSAKLQALKPQITRHASLAFGFSAVARHGVAVPWLAPVVRALGQPAEIRRAQQMRQRPAAVIVDVADKAEFAATL